MGFRTSRRSVQAWAEPEQRFTKRPNTSSLAQFWIRATWDNTGRHSDFSRTADKEEV
jgi:hypothetical protein